MFDLRDIDFQRKLNSLTKYPPIPTFHELGKGGMLDGSKPVDFAGQLVNVTEKIDGTNARIIVFPDGRFVIGSRENLLACSRDWILNPELGIVRELWDVAGDLASLATLTDGMGVRVYFFEVYGGRINGWKNYAKSGEIFGHRLFDVIEFPDEVFTEVMCRSREDISLWRQHGGQPFVGWDRLLKIAQETNLQRVPTIEHCVEPQGIAFKGLEHTLATLEGCFPDGTDAMLESGAQGRPEGVVFKSQDGTIRAKLRFEDYRATINRLEAAKRKEAKLAMRNVE